MRTPLAIGDRFGRLVVTAARAPGEPLVNVRCDCGTDLVVKFRLLGNRRNSCGCAKRGVGNGRYRHGMADTKIYRIWADMVGRATRETHARWADYGGRGITVCDRWRVFDNFFADMGERPEGKSLDRIDNDLGYSPENCRWATATEQRANRRDSRQAVA